MLTRQKIILALLSRAEKHLSPTVFVKLVFLLRHETPLKDEPTFYDFVPYKYGPFSFALYRELACLRRDGFVAPDEELISLKTGKRLLAKKKAKELSETVRQAVQRVVTRYAGKSQTSLIKDVYARYPWYATRSELGIAHPACPEVLEETGVAAHTIGYQGQSVDCFFARLLKKGIRLIIDVRANPNSRQYGYSKTRLREIGQRLGIDYRHMPTLGIPSSDRSRLSDRASYQRLLLQYERDRLPRLVDEIGVVAELMAAIPAVLVCVEKDAQCCHRSCLANAVSESVGLEVIHL